ncbi:MAG: glycosyltransferase family 2 protein [Anaerolineae bacterium]
MKLIIQIPCYNEEDHLPTTLKDLPTTIEGFDEVEWLIIDDGSYDRTVEVARANGVHHIVRHPSNQGLARAFQSGITACIQLGADVIVNTDADNQYPGQSIPDLVRPILLGEADMVIGNRQTHTIAHFSPIKRLLQGQGSAVVRFISGMNVPDAPSGFRAISYKTALRLHIFTRYTYTLETIIQAGNYNLKVASIPVKTNPKTRESRLMKSMTSYVMRSAITILQLFLLYQPLRTFAYISTPFFLLGGGLWLRYILILLFLDPGRGANIQSITVGGVLILVGVITLLMGLMGNVIAFNRRLQEEVLYHLKANALLSTVLIEENPRDQAHAELNKYP